VMVSRMCNNTKDVETWVDNTLCVSATLRLCVKLRMGTQRREGAKTQRTEILLLLIMYAHRSLLCSGSD
ncbi:MAG: hypothetical protein KAU52_01980, partial [Methanosarcinales archaeon]|nr:hypothetical protein [Methanosarcinales archaeon]